MRGLCYLPPTPEGTNIFSPCPVLQKFQGPTATPTVGTRCLQCQLCAQGQPAQETRAALLPGSHRGLGAGFAEPGAG